MRRSKQNDLAMSYVATTITRLPGEAPRNTYITDMAFSAEWWNSVVFLSLTNINNLFDIFFLAKSIFLYH